VAQFSGKKVKVVSVRQSGIEDVYNMEVANHHNFAVNGGFIVHNCIDATRYAFSEDMEKGNKLGSIDIGDLGFR